MGGDDSAATVALTAIVAAAAIHMCCFLQSCWHYCNLDSRWLLQLVRCLSTANFCFFFHFLSGNSDNSNSIDDNRNQLARLL